MICISLSCYSVLQNSLGEAAKWEHIMNMCLKIEISMSLLVRQDLDKHKDHSNDMSV